MPLRNYASLIGQKIPSTLMHRAKAAHYASMVRDTRRATGKAAVNRLRMVAPGAYAMGGPLAAEGRRTTAAVVSANKTFRGPMANRGLRASRAPGRSRFSLAQNGKYIAAGVVTAGIGGAIVNRSGRPADKTIGRPTGIYGY